MSSNEGSSNAPIDVDASSSKRKCCDCVSPEQAKRSKSVEEKEESTTSMVMTFVWDDRELRTYVSDDECFANVKGFQYDVGFVTKEVFDGMKKSLSAWYEENDDENSESRMLKMDFEECSKENFEEFLNDFTECMEECVGNVESTASFVSVVNI